MRSILKLEICFLKPPGPSSTFSAGTRQFPKCNSHHCSPLMNMDGAPMVKPGVSRSTITEPIPPRPGP
jgi:hypothetical protein